jgi:hypothetical protein
MVIVAKVHRDLHSGRRARDHGELEDSLGRALLGLWGMESAVLVPESPQSGTGELHLGDCSDSLWRSKPFLRDPMISLTPFYDLETDLHFGLYGSQHFLE